MRFTVLTPLLAACTLFGAEPAFAADATGPAKKPESGTPAPPKSAGLKFSQPHGFQSAPFELSIAAIRMAGEVRYTLDGSAPGAKNGQVYRGPIPIRSSTVVRAAFVTPDGRASRPQTRTYLFTSDIIRQSPDGLPPDGWPYQWGQNNVDYGMDPAVVDDPKYREAIEPALKSLPVYSLVMDLGDLFDEERGIYANSGESGRSMERPASLELLPGAGGKGFQEECGVRIRGGFSSGGFNPKHGFRLFFRKEYGAAKLKYPVFGEDGVREFDSFDLRCSQNYSWNIGNDVRGLFLRDQFNRDLQRAMGQPAARGDFCHLFINGQYWGLYDTCERPEASFAAATLGGREEDYDVVKTGGVSRGMSVGATDGSMDAWRRLHTAAKADLSDNANYFRLLGRKPDGTPDPALEVLLDPTNLVDYLLVIWYGGNLDAPVTRFGGNRAPNNWHAARNRTSRDGFQFFIWDAEHTLLDVEEDRTGPFPGGDQPEASHPQWLFQRCSDNAEFRVLVADRIQKHFGPGGVLSTPVVLERFRKRVAEIEQAVICESARWGDAGGGFMMGPPDMSRPMRPGPDGQPKPFPRTRDKEWRAEVRRQLEDYLPRRGDIVKFQLWRQGFVSDLPAPQVVPAPGKVKAGDALRLSAAAPQAEVWYTLDGQDPRRHGGETSASARKAESSMTLKPGASTILARTRIGSEWGPLVAAEFVVD